jgi:membrane-associated protein
MLDIDQWIELLGTLYDRWGYLIVFLGALFENTALLGLFLPGASLALLGAFYAQQGTLQLGWVIFFAWAGTVFGYHADYLLGRLLLTRLLGLWGDSWLGRRLRLAARVRLGGRFLTRHGGKAILLSHVVGHVRSFVALSAGATHMTYRRFLAFELVAALLWNTAFCLLGYFAGTERERLQLLLERSGWVVLAVVVALFVGWRILRGRRGRRVRHSRPRATRHLPGAQQPGEARHLAR